MIEILARKGKAARVKKGQTVKVINSKGQQVVDTWAFSAADLHERMSMEHSRVAIGRIVSLARNARDGRLEGPDGVLSGDPREEGDRGYYFRSTLYQLLAPLGVCYMLQTHLTFQDMTLDPWINRQFFLSENRNPVQAVLIGLNSLFDRKLAGRHRVRRCRATAGTAS